MQYSRFQKNLSLLLIFSILTLQTVEVPVFQTSRANASDHRDLVSLIVDEDMYSGDMKSKILRYAEDIQGYRANTRAVIFPVPKTVNPFSIASINEKLYYEGDGQSLSRLVGTVLIGDLPLPVVHRNGKAFLSVYPYTDFENKSFVYDPTKGYYDYSGKSSTDDKPEVWHSVIRPNTGNTSNDTAKLLAFLDKTHDYYTKQGNFSAANTLSEPRVFYFDGLHDEKTSNATSWKLYNLGLKYAEDIAYNRFNKYLAKTLYDASQKLLTVDTSAIKDRTLQKLLAENSDSSLDLSKNPDITTRDIILKSTKQFFEVFNKTYMGDVLRFVYSTGRYGDDTNVRVDSVPVMIAKRDIFARQTLKDANTVIEWVIDDVVGKGLARNVAISTAHDIDTTTYTAADDGGNVVIGKPQFIPHTSHTAYANYFIGRKAETITRALQCTIVRGSTLAVEENRGYNIGNIEPDTSTLTSGGAGCFSGGKPLVSSFWGGNSPLGLDSTSMKTGKFELGSHRYAGFPRSAYDMAGAKELAKDSALHIATPEDCLARDFLLQQGFGCNTVHQSISLQSFSDYYQSLPSEQCTTKSLVLDGKTIKSSGTSCEPDLDVVNYAKSYTFKSVPSVMEHKSPTDEEYGAALKSMTTPSLASDRDRYVDFISARGNYAKIVYPNLFRITLAENEMDYEWARKKIKSIYDAKSNEINALIAKENPSALSGTDKELANLLRISAYPTTRVDLYAKLAENEKALAAAVENVLWNNLDNATLKYAFILERSLDIDGNAKISVDSKRNDYEIASLGAPGDARNMYVKIDPEAKGLVNTGVMNIMTNVATYRSLVSSTNIATLEENPKFDCGPPEWVPIQQWLPAIFCWLGTILPPKISAGSCTTSSLPLRDDSQWSDTKYTVDANKNGIIDGNEVITHGQLQLTSDGEQYGYGSSIPLQATLLKDGKIISIDSFNRVTFDLVSLTAYSGSASGGSRRVVYDRSGVKDGLGNISNITPYITFKSAQIPAQNGVAKYLFSAKNSDVDAVFEATIRTYDRDGNLVVDRTSNRLDIAIRSERISVQSEVLGWSGYATATSVEAGGADGIRFTLKKVSEDGIVANPSLPYTLRITDDVTGAEVVSPINVAKGEYAFSDTSILNKAGIYRFAFTDHRGVTGYTTLNVLPAPPVRLEVTPSSNTFVRGERATVLVRLLDRFGNLANSRVYTVRGEVSGGGYFTDKDSKNLGSSTDKWVVDGYTSFDVTSDASGRNTVKFRVDRVNLESSITSLQSVDFAQVSVEVDDRDAITVDGGKHRIKLSVTDRDNKRLTGFNGVAAIAFPKLSGTLSSSFVKIVDGVSTDELFLTPGTVAGKDLALSVSIAGIKTAKNDTVTVLPGVPMIADFANPNPRMEAKNGNTTTIRATLYDRYGNIAYNVGGHSLTLEIPEEYQKFARLASVSTLPFVEGTLTFDVAATFRPGKAYVIGRVSPDLSRNSFSLTDSANKTITVRGVSANTTLIDTYYLFNEEKLDKLRYDALYTTLLGGEYGDVTKFGYLGGSILFDDASKSLAVTSLMNAPWKRDQLFGLTPAGKYSYTEKSDSLGGFTAELASDSDRTFISFYDRYSRDYIARAWLRFDAGATDLFACAGSGTTSDISDCRISDRTSIVLKWFGSAIGSLEGNNLVLKSADGTMLLRINRSGAIDRYPGVSLELDPTQTANMLGVKVVSNRTTVGYLGIKFAATSIEAYPSSSIAQVLSNRKNTIVLEAISSRYAYDKTYLGNSSRGAQGIVFYAKDSYMNLSATDPTYAGRQDMTGLEQYPTKTGIGWEGSNRSMLELAGGSSVGEANKSYATYSTITLGDAVATLPRITSATTNFDRTIGKSVSAGAGEQIESYKKIDFNADGLLDVVVFYESGKIQLLANYDGSLKDMGYLAYVSDAGKERKWVGDFFRDRYEDIALVDKNGKLIVLDNIEGKFSRTDPIILSASGGTVALAGAIRQLEIFDMDRDGYADIVTVDEGGELNILYGWVRTQDGVTRHVFTKKLVDNGLGISVSPNARNDGGAFTYDGLPVPTAPVADTDAGSLSTTKTILDNMIYYQDSYAADRIQNSPALRNAILRSAVGTTDSGTTNSDMVDTINSEMSRIALLAGSGRVDYSALDTSNRESKKTYIRSQYAEARGLSVEKRYKDLNGTPFASGDQIQVTIKLTNTTGSPMRKSIYLDSNNTTLFEMPSGTSYKMTRNGTGMVLPMVSLEAGDYDLAFDLGTLAPNETVEISYGLLGRAVSYGRIYVGLLERGEKWDDIYGDIAMNPNNTCGGSVTIWRSVEPYPRSYERGTKTFRDTSELPEELKKNAIDTNGNGTPDYIDDLIASSKSGDVSAIKKYSDEQLATYNEDVDGDGIPDRADSSGRPLLQYNTTNGEISVAGLGASNIAAINGQIDDVVRGLGCWFGGGGCINAPINWAPLAPGSSPSILGFPLVPSMMTPWWGLPIFAAPAFCGIIPGVWPPCPLGAGGWLGPAGVSQFRLFVTPTITGAMGTAACFGPNVGGLTPPPGVSPLIPGGNCVVAAMPFFGCSGDGSDGDARSIGLGFGSSAFNGASCRVRSSASTSLSGEDRSNILRYIGGDNARLPELNAMLSQGAADGGPLGSSPLIGIGLGSGEEPNFEVSIDPEALRDFDFGNILKIKNRRISAFPDFIMEWVTRQMEEVFNKITTLPTLHVVFPDFDSMDLSGYTNFPDKFSEAVENDKTDYADKFRSKTDIKNETLKDEFGKVQGGLNATVDEHADAINTIGRNVSGVRAAYEFMSHLPLIALEDQTVDIDIPWMSIEDADKWYKQAEKTVKQWRTEIEDKSEKWSELANKDGSGVDKQVILRAQDSLDSLEENMRIIDEYRKFPAKLQKYLTWKERYADQLICNVEAIEMIMGGWIAENGKRFRTWVELYVLIKAILKSWQLIIDLFNDYNETCAPCRNERWDLKHFIFKLISAVIPKIPIIQFPKWPDIWVDMHNIRAGLRILMPEFHFEFVPIVLPNLPELHLPDVPTLGVNLPSLPLLPRFPALPDLPDLPSLPTIELPNLPPPPTIPKLFGGIAAVLEILKLVSKILCILQINPFVPEWRAGDQIAQITERTGKLPIDFLMLDLPQFSLSFVDAIKVTSYVNLNFDSEFILEMVRATLEPLNTMTNNVSNIGSYHIPNANFQDIIPSGVDIDVKPKVIEDAKKEGYVPSATYLRFATVIVDRFVRLNAFVAEHAQDEVGLETMKQILSDNARLLAKSDDPKVREIASTLDRAVRYDVSDEEGFIRDLQARNTEKFGLVKEYIKGEQLETKRLQTELDEMLRTGADMTQSKSFAPRFSPNIKIASTVRDTGSSKEYAAKLRILNDRIIPSMTSIASGNEDSEARDIRATSDRIVAGVRSDLRAYSETLKRNEKLHSTDYASSVSSLLAADTSSATSSNTSSSDVSALSSAYSYNYQGIYIFDAKGNQKRLFDYVDAVDGTEQVIYLDVDHDGDEDILYRMDNNLYVKENHEKEPSAKKSSDSPRTMDYTDFLRISSATSLTRAAPNFFEEAFVSSNEINFSFSPAHPDRDTLFRLEYYDYIDRFDRIVAGESHQTATPNTLLHKVDLIPNLVTDTLSDASITGLVVRKNIATFQWGEGDGVMTAPHYEVMTSGNNSRKIIAANRTIHTDAGGATIEYIPSGATERKTLSIAKSSNVTFLAGAEITVTSGNIYLFGEALETRTVTLDAIKWLPIMPGTKLEINNKNARSSIRYYDGSIVRLDGPVAYEYYDLGEKAKDYSVTIAAPNSWYYAELYSFSAGVIGTIATLKLLAPQRSADREWPLITYGDTIRIPVYQERKLDLGKYIEDISGVTKVWVDADLTKDSDGNGKIDDDRDSLDTKTSYRIKKGANQYELVIGAFDSLFSKKIRLFAQDANGNTTSKDLILFVYAPTPDITSVTGSLVSGALDESLIGEPIDLFRYRNGGVVRIDPRSASGSLTIDGGRFSIPTRTGSGLLLASVSATGSVKKEIAWIDEDTGRVEIRDSSYTLSVIPAMDNDPMRIRILAPNGDEIFTQSFALDPKTRVETVSSFDEASGSGVSVTIASSSHAFYRNVTNAPFIPDGGYIVDADRKAVAGISRKGDMYVMNSDYRLDYSSRGDYVMIRILDRSGAAVASVLYKVRITYVVK